MLIRIGYEITLACESATPLVLALSPHTSQMRQTIGTDAVRTEPGLPSVEFVDTFGNRRTRMVAPPGRTTLWSDCIVEDDGLPDPLDWTARQSEIPALPSDTLAFLTASRYCEVDEIVAHAWALFGNTPPGWARVQAIANYVHNHLTFGYQFARSTKTAVDALRERTGVCRDYAQLAVAFCRAMNIPARYASGYLGDIGVPNAGPGDFSAWFEAFVGDRWYTFDARHNVPRIGRVLMVRGQDAADVPMITAFGTYRLELFRVWTDEVVAAPGEDLSARLAQRPFAPALTLAPWPGVTQPGAVSAFA